MTAPVSKNAATTGKVALDPPIFDPDAFRLSDEQADIIARARELGQSVFASRAAAYDREAKFPTENYRDLHRAGLLGISIAKKHGGLGADYQTYSLAAAEIGRYCGATALTWITGSSCGCSSPGGRGMRFNGSTALRSSDGGGACLIISLSGGDTS